MDDKKANGDWRPRSGGRFLGGLRPTLGQKKKKKLGGEGTVLTLIGSCNLMSFMSDTFWNPWPVQSKVWDFSHPLLTSLEEKGGVGGVGGLGQSWVEQKAERLGKLSTHPCEPDPWMQIQ